MALIVDGIYSLFFVYLCEDICASFVNDGERTSNSDLGRKPSTTCTKQNETHLLGEHRGSCNLIVVPTPLQCLPS